MSTNKILQLAFILLVSGSIAKAQIPANSTDISPLLLGEKLPDAELTGSNGFKSSVYELIKEKPTVILFYNGLWCYFCGVHFTEQIAPVADEITALGYNMIAISPDMPDSLAAMSRKVGLPARIFYQDGSGSFATAMGIAYQQPENNLSRLVSYSGGLNKGFLPVPSVFVVDPDQTILYEYINPNGMASNLRIRGEFLITVLQALKSGE